MENGESLRLHSFGVCASLASALLLIYVNTLLLFILFVENFLYVCAHTTHTSRIHEVKWAERNESLPHTSNKRTYIHLVRIMK